MPSQGTNKVVPFPFPGLDRDISYEIMLVQSLIAPMSSTSQIADSAPSRACLVHYPVSEGL